jgi:hypothetical protein
MLCLWSWYYQSFFLSMLIKVLVAGIAWYCMGQTKPCNSRCWLWSCQLWRLHVWQRCAYHVFCSKRWAWSSSTICTRKGNSSNISCNGHQETSIPQQGLWCHSLRSLQGPLAHWRFVLLVTCLPFFYQFSVEVNLVADSCCFRWHAFTGIESHFTPWWLLCLVCHSCLPKTPRGRRDLEWYCSYCFLNSPKIDAIF